MECAEFRTESMSADPTGSGSACGWDDVKAHRTSTLQHMSPSGIFQTCVMHENLMKARTRISYSTLKPTIARGDCTLPP
jgi:hypothetical protein